MNQKSLNILPSFQFKAKLIIKLSKWNKLCVWLFKKLFVICMWFLFPHPVGEPVYTQQQFTDPMDKHPKPKCSRYFGYRKSQVFLYDQDWSCDHSITSYKSDVAPRGYTFRHQIRCQRYHQMTPIVKDSITLIAATTCISRVGMPSSLLDYVCPW